MRPLTAQELDLCRLQGRLFEASLDYFSGSSPIFIRRFMNSEMARRFDTDSALFESTTPRFLFDELEREYGPSTYGTTRYGSEVLYWMGYLYRYWSCAAGITSKLAFKTIPARELSELYGPYHSLDPGQAIERICEAKGIRAIPRESEGRVEEGVALLRRMHQRNTYEYYVMRY